MGRLERLDLDQDVPEEEYDRKIERLQLEMLTMQHRLRQSDGRAVILFEGWDASGKGGAIRRLTDRIDPRGYSVHPIGPPDEVERRHHYLWRFWKRLPAAGIFAIFDRSWYGRVLVERVEKLTPKKIWRRAYGEINAFEETLANDGTPVIKFFLHVSAREQLKRFRERERNPFKRWKIGPDDWRNRKNRKKYLEAYEDMFEETHTKRCPWHLIPADSKRHARLEVLRRTVRVLGGLLPPADFEHESGEKPGK